MKTFNNGENIMHLLQAGQNPHHWEKNVMKNSRRSGWTYLPRWQHLAMHSDMTTVNVATMRSCAALFVITIIHILCGSADIGQYTTAKMAAPCNAFRYCMSIDQSWRGCHALPCLLGLLFRCCVAQPRPTSDNDTTLDSGTITDT